MNQNPFDQEDVMEGTLREVFARPPAPADHPPPDELLDYHLRLLLPEDLERIQNHLARCAECAQMVLDYQIFTSPEPVAAESEPSDRDREWARIQARLQSSKAVGRWARFQAPWPLAASLLLSAGLFGWALALRHDLTEAKLPRADAVSAFVEPEGATTRRAGDAPTQIALLPGVGWISLSLNLGDAQVEAIYRLELRREGGTLIWEESNAPRGEDGSFTLQIPAHLLQPGIYDVRLFAAARGREGLAATYRFKTARPSRPRER